MKLQDKITIQFIIDTSSSLIDLKWKLNKFLKNGDVSYLGHLKFDLNNKIKQALDKEKRPTASVKNKNK